MKNPAPVMRDHEKAMEHTKGERRHGEEIHCRDGFTMVAQKRRPSLCRLRVAGRFPHPAQRRALGDVEAEHLQLAVNARRTPGRVFGPMREIGSRNSLLTPLLPPRVRRRESHFQYSLKPTLRQRTTVSGWTIIKAFRQTGQRARSITQSNPSALEN